MSLLWFLFQISWINYRKYVLSIFKKLRGFVSGRPIFWIIFRIRPNPMVSVNPSKIRTESDSLRTIPKFLNLVIKILQNTSFWSIFFIFKSNKLSKLQIFLFDWKFVADWFCSPDTLSCFTKKILSRFAFGFGFGDFLD